MKRRKFCAQLLSRTNFTYVMCVVSYRNAGQMQASSLLLERYPITTVYLARQSGRIAGENKNHYASQTSMTLIAHKSQNFVCHGGGTGGRRRAVASSSSSTHELLEELGVVVSPKHPESKTFLAPAMANHLIKR